MKKIILVFSAFFMVAALGAQTLDEIINKNYTATGGEKLSKLSSLYIEGKASQMGIEMDMTMYMKQPDKVKMVVNYNGMEIITLFDGTKGYMVNPMMGSSDPVEIPAEQLGNVKENNLMNNQLLEFYRKGKMTLEGTEDVDGKPAFKISVATDNGNPLYFFIDKESYMTVKTSTKVNQMGQEMEVESYVKEYTDIDGIKFPKISVSLVNGMEAATTTFNKIELNKEIEDSVFTIN